MRILVVDDDPDIRETLRLLLALEGYEVDAAEDGLEGLARLRAGPRPSLILLDLMMPRLDGEGLVREMRRDPSLAEVPVVILSGHGAARCKAAELGVAGCLVKPIELEELLATIRRVGGK